MTQALTPTPKSIIDAQCGGGLNAVPVFFQLRDCSKKIEDLFANGDPGDEKLAVQLNKMSAQVIIIIVCYNCNCGYLVSVR